MEDTNYLATVLRLKLSCKEYSILKEMTRAMKNLYNQGLYLFYNCKEKNMSYGKAEKLLKSMEEHNNYYKVKPACSQQLIRNTFSDISSFKSKLSNKLEEETSEKINPPRYLEKDSYYKITFPKSCFRRYLGGVDLRLGKYIKKKYNQETLFVKLPRYLDGVDIKIIVINPQYNGLFFNIEIVYEHKKDLLNRNYPCIKKIYPNHKNHKKYLDRKYNYDNQINSVNYKHYLSIDLGIDNLLTCFDTRTRQPFILSGRDLKSYNSNFNKVVSKEKSHIMKVNNKYSSKRICLMYNKRNNKIKDYFHKITTSLVDHCLKYNIGNIVIGYNTGWKQKSKLGKVNNQNFVNIPFYKFMRMLSYKCKYSNINLIAQQESYTSKLDFLANEPLTKRENFLGKRIKRGLFQSSKGYLINSDVNGSLNILRKAVNYLDYDKLIELLIKEKNIFNPKRIRIKMQS